VSIAIVVTVIGAVTAGVALAAKPVSGTLGGPVTAVSGSTFTLKSSLSPKGKAMVHVGSKTTITNQVNGTRADLKRGMCLVGIGQKDKNGVVQAARVTLSSPIKGRCTGGFGGPPNGRPAQGSPQPPQGAGQPPQGPRPQGNVANFGFATGAITAVNGNVVTVHGQAGTSKVALQAKAQIVKTVVAKTSAIKVGLCAFVTGTSSDKGANVTAQAIRLSKPGARGCTGPS
jgi:hypothetical protein